MVSYIVPVELENGVEMRKPLDTGSGEGGARDRKVESFEPIYYNPFEKMVDNDPREINDLVEWFTDMVEGNEYFIDDEDDFSNLGGSFGKIIEIAKELKVSIRRSLKFCREELTFLGEKEGDEGLDRIEWMTRALAGLDDIIDIRRSGIINFEDMAPRNLKQTADDLKKVWLVDMVLGGVIRRYVQFKEFEKGYAEYIKTNYPDVEGHREWREKKWKTAHASLYRALKERHGG